VLERSSTAPPTSCSARRRATGGRAAYITTRILRPAIKAANATREEAGQPPLPDGITNHSLRRTFASLLYEAGANPAYVMSQMGHTSSSLALEIYAKKMEVARDTGQRMDALVRPNWNGDALDAGEAVFTYREELTRKGRVR
jgi:integrase